MTEEKTRTDEELKAAVLEAALGYAVEDGFTDRTVTRAGTDAGVGCEMMLHLFPQGLASLVEFYSGQNDAEMERLLAKENLAEMKVRDRIAATVLTRLEILKPHKEAARRAAAFLLLPMNAPLGAKLLYRTVDTMWRAAGDTSTDFNFYTKRAILAGVYSSTMMRWFNDKSDDAAATREFLSARIENVMQFERLKAEVRERTKDLPSFADILKGFSAPRS
jgi:ubiquinone biosynthesis protein COQ9